MTLSRGVARAAVWSVASDLSIRENASHFGCRARFSERCECPIRVSRVQAFHRAISNPNGTSF
jgi:hypothetical protein